MSATTWKRARRLVYHGGPLGRLARRLRPRALVLVYHRVAEPAFDPFGLAVPPALFEAHLAVLRSHFHVDSLEGVLDRLPRRACADGTIAVTFDDGYADNLHAAQPIARDHDVPVTFFVTADPVLEGGRFWWDDLARALVGLRGRTTPIPLEIAGRTLAVGGSAPEGPSRETAAERGASRGGDAELRRVHRHLMAAPPGDRDRAIARLLEEAEAAEEGPEAGRPLTRAELRELAARPGARVGAHSWSHPSLRSLPGEEQRRELERGRAALEEVTGGDVTLLAYPFGRTRDVDPITTALAERAGYRAAFTTAGSALTPGLARRHPHALPRLTVHPCAEGELLSRVRTALADA